MLPAYGAVDSISDPLDVTIQVQARAHLDIELVEPTFAEAVRVVDAEARPVEILRMRADGHSNFATLPLDGGRSGVVTVTSDAAHVEFLRDGEVVATVPVRLRPGELRKVMR